MEVKDRQQRGQRWEREKAQCWGAYVLRGNAEQKRNTIEVVFQED